MLRLPVSVFATFALKVPRELDSVLLTLGLMGGGDSLNTAEHFAFLGPVLNVSGEIFSSVAVLVGDNCNTNSAIASRVRQLFVGCYSNHYNIALKAVVVKNEEVFESVRHL